METIATGNAEDAAGNAIGGSDRECDCGSDRAMNVTVEAIGNATETGGCKRNKIEMEAMPRSMQRHRTVRGSHNIVVT